jgi:hypothetical protein
MCLFEFIRVEGAWSSLNILRGAQAVKVLGTFPLEREYFPISSVRTAIHFQHFGGTPGAIHKNPTRCHNPPKKNYSEDAVCTRYVQSTDHELITASNASRVLRQCTVPRAEVGLMLVTIQRENIRPSKKEMNKAVTMLKLPDVWTYLWITSPYRWPVGSLPSTCMLCTPPALH